MNHNQKSSVYWRGFVTGAMLGAGGALLLAQRKQQEKNDSSANSDSGINPAVEIFGDKDSAQAAKDSWNETLENAKTPSANLPKNATN